MEYISYYQSPLGRILMAADDDGLTGLWFEGQRYFALSLDEEHAECLTPMLSAAAAWLDIYFSGGKPDFQVPLHIKGAAFHKEVSAIMQSIPYGTTMTYGEIAATAAARLGRPRMSARAAGGAVGHNAVSIIVPCHRVVGAGNSLTGYAGGIWRKVRLLQMEGADISRFRIPMKEKPADGILMASPS